MVADGLSRLSPLESEWSLDLTSFQFIRKQVPGLHVDLFATMENHKLPLYIAPNVDPQAVGTDALQLDWNQWMKIEPFPPPNLILKVLNKLRSFRGTAAVVAPFGLKAIGSHWY